MLAPRNQCANSENPHRVGTKAHDQWESRRVTRQAKLEARAEKQRQLSAAIDAGQAIVNRPPDSFSTWGVMRTRTWAAINCRLQRELKKKRPVKERLESLTAAMTNISTERTSVDTCAQILNDL